MLHPDNVQVSSQTIRSWEKKYVGLPVFNQSIGNTFAFVLGSYLKSSDMNS